MHERNTTAISFLETLLCGRISLKKRVGKRDIENIFRVQRPRNMDLAHESLAAICLAFEAGMKRRSFIITKHGHIGAGPEEVEPDDLVCVLLGCSVPVVLRKIIGKDACEFVGECYLHGFMDGETTASVRGKTYELREFNIR
jgi:hypothetical protein